MIKHIVMWKLIDVKNAGLIKTRLDALPAIIPQIIDFEVGVDVNRSEPAFDLVLYSSFATKEDMKIYAEHPAHKEVGALISTLVAKRCVVDYEV